MTVITEEELDEIEAHVSAKILTYKGDQQKAITEDWLKLRETAKRLVEEVRKLRKALRSLSEQVEDMPPEGWERESKR